MKLFHDVLQQMRALLPEQPALSAAYRSDLCAESGDKNAILFRSDTAYELGGSGKSGVSSVLFGEIDASQDEVLVYGKDLCELTQDTAFEAQFARNDEGIEQAVEGRMFTLSPNPARDEVTVTVDGQGCWLTLRDEAGRELLRRQVEGRETLLSTRGLAAGLYFVTIESPRGSSTQKLVVE